MADCTTKNEVKQAYFEGERPLFGVKDLYIEDTIMLPMKIAPGLRWRGQVCGTHALVEAPKNFRRYK